MKFGVHAGLWQRAWSDDPAPIMSRVKALGYHGVELSLLGVGFADAGKLRTLSDNLDLALTCSTGLGVGEDPGSSDPERRSAAIKTLTGAVKTAGAMGARNLSGVVASPWGYFDPARKAERAKYASETLAQLDGVLRGEGVVLGIEALNRFESDLTNTAAETTAIAKATGSQNIGVLLDTFHMNVEEKSPPDAINETGKALVHFHISENDRGVPGSGQYDFGAAAQALSRIGYDGWVVAEMFVMAGNPASADVNIWRNIEADPTEAARTTLSFMQRTFSL
ncbi:sugar phosphate isomerase/epimerase family protein [Devosia marina]|jgi:D-psicose/D-tagatose/L-ribulose 3-epimerase|uniref:TIM barrel protein n=1 Tax=Devosia marina TaxID=2683198 RepID=A0A7X3FQH0_9HYPH|nr:sugar phosphate isomerase/epimerase [Devosia marina]MVS98907.1 TIM barrel protein [Devosia marina]